MDKVLMPVMKFNAFEILLQLFPFNKNLACCCFKGGAFLQFFQVMPSFTNTYVDPFQVVVPSELRLAPTSAPDDLPGDLRDRRHTERDRAHRAQGQAWWPSHRQVVFH